MSRLTASPFHKPKPFEFPRGLPSPPETNPDMFSTPAQISSAQANAGQEFTASDAPYSAGDIPTSRLRKPSSIPYHSPGFRDNKDRSSQRVNKALIIVIPPSTLLQEHGRDVTLTSGPYHRLSQGIVMPLLPSMFAQVTAIAREFNFPSTAGICLYYQYTEDGLTLTPRISDDSWQTIWAHLSEPAGPNEKRPLISGKIEFDIDHRIARWYGAWISSIFREVSEMNQYPATAPSYGHARAESRTTLPDGRVYDDDDGSVIIQQSAPVTVTRHIPKKLSLVERFETASVRTDLKAAPRSIGTPPEILPSASQAPVLSPIVQEEEPKTARQDLNSRVKSWRASAILTPTPLAATGQTSLEPVNLPNSMETELHMEDYTWSISSPGPSSYADGSPLVSEYSYIPSVHLDRRLKGSVCTTPSMRTSFGPSDYDPFSPTFLSFEERVPSPDIAQRFFEDSPLTPLTATSWGAPLSYPPSPRCASPVPSVDLGERSRYEDIASQHSTRSHSMWRASLARAAHEESPVINWRHVWPYTESRNFESAPAAHGTSGVWPHVWPYNQNKQTNSTTTSVDQAALQLVPTWQHVWPYNASSRILYSAVQDMNHYPHNLQHIYPPHPAADHDKNAYPHNLANLYPPVPASLYATSSRGYPYNLVNIYPPIAPNSTALVSSRLGYPYNLYNIYGISYPHNLTLIYPPLSVSRHFTDSQGYPHNLANIYPARTVVTDNRKASFSVGPLESYPYNLSQIYAAVYPQNLTNIYPVACISQEVDFPRRTGSVAYPHNLKLIYPPITQHDARLASSKLHGYPYNLSNIYPPIRNSGGEELTKVGIGYPYHLQQLYPPVYPHNLANIYPSVHHKEPEYHTTVSLGLPGYPHNLTRIYPAAGVGTLNIALKTDELGYPHNLELIYPPICRRPSPGYPHNLAMIYPVVDVEILESGIKDNQTDYPHNLRLLYLPIRPHVLLGYPHNLSNLYPATTNRHKAEPLINVHELESLSPGYPFNLSNIYPALAHSHRAIKAMDSPIGYPHNLMHLYAPVYPYNLDNLYPITPDIRALNAVDIKVNLMAISPSMNDYPLNLTRIYPPHDSTLKVSTQRSSDHYPHNLLIIYPSVEYGRDSYPNLYSSTLYHQSRSTSDSRHSEYPFLNLYPSVTPLRFAHCYLHLCNPRGGYPHFEIYPSVERTNTLTDAVQAMSPVLLDAVATYVRYPTFNIYPTVYPHFDLYPPLTTVSAVKLSAPKSTISSSRLTHAELHAVVMMEKMGSLRMMQRPGSNPVSAYPDGLVPRSIAEKTPRSERPDLDGTSPLSRAPGPSQDARRPVMPSSLLMGKRPPLDAPSRISSSSTLPQSILRPAPNSIPSNQLTPAVDTAIPRSSSLRVSPISKPEHPFPVKAPARRRDSLVFQRIRAYDSNVESSPLSKETLAKFPMPPRMPLPPLPTDRRI